MVVSYEAKYTPILITNNSIFAKLLKRDGNLYSQNDLSLHILKSFIQNSKKTKQKTPGGLDETQRWRNCLECVRT